MKPSREEILQRAAPFRELPAEDQRHLAAVAQVRSFAAGAPLFRQGDESGHFFSLVSGRVKVFKTSRTGKDIILGIFGPGDPVGSVAVFKERPYPASASALEETVCVCVARDDLYRLLERHPSIARGMLLGLTQRLVELVNRIGEFTGARVEPRLARLFLRLADEIGRPLDAGVFIPLALSRQELSDMTGTTIETSIRVMSRWHKEHIVGTRRDGFLLLDRETLESIASS